MVLGSGERVRLPAADRVSFFNLVRQSAAFEGWAALERHFQCGHTTFKNWKRGRCLLPSEVFDVLLSYLEPGVQERFKKVAVWLPKNWAAVESGKKSIQKLRERLGEKGYAEHFDKFRKMRKINPGVRLMGWYRGIQKRSPDEYARLMKERVSVRSRRIGEYKQEYFQKRAKTILERYGAHHYTKIGLAVAEKLPLTLREMTVLKQTPLDVGVSVKQHVTFLDFNVDFAYYLDGHLIAVEEVLSFKKQKCSLFFDLLILHEKFKKLQTLYPSVPFLVTTWFEEKSTGRICRFPMDLAAWCLEKGFVLLFLDTGLCRKVRAKILSGDLGATTVPELEAFIRLKMRDLQRFKNGAVSQSRQPFDQLETRVDAILSEHGFLPKGKKMVPTRFGTYIVTDNFLGSNGLSTAVFLSKKHLDGLIGSAAMIKELVDEKVQTLCATEAEITSATPNQKLLIQKYIDKYYPSITSFEQQYFADSSA